jgi:hypothetical protein
MKNEKELLTSSAKEELVEQENKTRISRRSFLKKTAYSAPVLMAMGQLAKPTFLQADGSGSTVSGPSGPPTGWNP